MNNKVAIFGACSQLGLNLIDSLSTSDHQIIALDILQNFKLSEQKNVEYIKLNNIVDLENLKKISNQIGQVKGIVNFIGKGVYTPTTQRTVNEIDDVFNVNIKSFINIVTAFNSKICKMGGGFIINVSSVYGIKVPDKRIYGDSNRLSSEIYGATKNALIHLTRYYAAFFGEDGIRFNTISPGGIFNFQDKDFVTNYENKVPLGRMGEPSDISNLIVFLMSDKSSYITGQNIIIDGGFSLW